MTTPSNGSISMQQVASELSVSTTNINLNQVDIRLLAGKVTGPISLSDLYSKTYVPPQI
jgi:hypothetical protein